MTLALEVPGARAVATDVSPGALAVAAGNARRLGAAGRVFPVRTDLTAGLDLSRFDLVISNPPYIDPAEAPSLSPRFAISSRTWHSSRPAAGTRSSRVCSRLCRTAIRG